MRARDPAGRSVLRAASSVAIEENHPDARSVAEEKRRRRRLCGIVHGKHRDRAGIRRGRLAEGARGGSRASGGAGGSPPATRAVDDLHCLEGYVPDPKKHICVRAQSGILPDQDLTDYAFALAKKERFQEALDALDLLQNPNTAVALNYRGYATRKLGRPTKASATTCNPSRSTRPIRRCANISAKPTSSRAASISPRSNSPRSPRSAAPPANTTPTSPK